MVVALVILAVTTAASAGAEPAVHPVDFQGRPFVATFNAAKEHPRLVGIFSPRCAHCLQTCADVRDVLAEYADADIQVFILWAPFEAGDNIGWARRAADAYLPDPRVIHFWDVWKFSSRAYTEILRVPVSEAWGLLLGFPAGEEWRDRPPKPRFWFQSRNLKVGTPFSEKLLRMRLAPWLETETD
ncbi:MAG: hypothetical protein Kow00109_05260 [Acidobacteriota bacterium]